MQKELRYQDAAEQFIKAQWEAYNGRTLEVLEEGFSVKFDQALQSGLSPLVRDVSAHLELTSLGIVGLQQKLELLNTEHFVRFIEKTGISLSARDLAILAFEDFHTKYKATRNEAEQFSLVFGQHHEVAESRLRRVLAVPGTTAALDYNVIFFEKPGSWSGLNSVFIIRERRIPIVHDTKKSERPDFMVYLNGIPLVLIEYKTEDSGIAQGVADFEMKDSYECAPFKVTINDGRSVLFFSNVQSLKLKESRHSIFEWVHFGEKKHVGDREYTNAEYFFDELVCQPQNLYAYCMDCCSVVQDQGRLRLVNARIQQYYALKSIGQTMLQATRATLVLPFNYEFSHAQRSGKTITMKLLAYQIAKNFSNLYHTIFIYTPDLQIKTVLSEEFARAGYSRASVKVIETRTAYKEAVESLAAPNSPSASFNVFIVNMQKLSDNDSLTKLRVTSTGVLNIIDEAHHGQAKEFAAIRDQIFPNASNFLFTATGKSEMYAYYFPENKASGFRHKFTISDAKRCGITVPVHFHRAEKTGQFSDKLERFAEEVELRLAARTSTEAALHGVEHVDVVTSFANTKIRDAIKQRLNEESGQGKLDYIVSFMDTIKPLITFNPKALVYVDSVSDAKKYIKLIQARGNGNNYGGYHFGVDFAELSADNCGVFNPGIALPRDVESCFKKTRVVQDNSVVIDILFAVDKYQKGFDLPDLMVTFLDTSIQEPARMNQIYTRTATKRSGKSQGYCIDMSLDGRNSATFVESMSMYDNNEAKDCFIDEGLVETINNSLRVALQEIRTALSLTLEEFTSAPLILDRVLNEPVEERRAARQDVFFQGSRKIIGALSKVGSPLYYRPFMLELKALFEAFQEFKVIYANSGHPEYAKIAINVDGSFNKGAFLTRQEIKDVINEVLNFVGEKNLTSLLKFGYVNSSSNAVAVDEARKDYIRKMQDEERANELKRRFDQMGDSLRTNHRPLFEHLRNLLLSISENRAIVYEEETKAKIRAVESELVKFKESLRETIRVEFGNNAVLYWLYSEAANLFRQERIEADMFSRFVASKVEPKLRVVLSQLDARSSIFDRATLAMQEVLTKKGLGNRFTSYYSEFSDVGERAKLGTRLKELSVAARAMDAESFANDVSVFEKYLFTAIKNYYQNLEA